MNQFTVPQFIEVEDKIIGPITIRQFIILLVTGLTIFILYKILTFTFFVISGLILFGMGGTLAFFRINGLPFYSFLLNMLRSIRSQALQIWDKTPSDSLLRFYAKSAPPPPLPVKVQKVRVSSSRLAEIALTVDTGGVYEPE